MNQGETLFYLREIQTHWSTSNVSREKLAELKATKLIEMNDTPLLAVRLTPEGARFKSAGRPSEQNGAGIRPSAKASGVRRHHARKKSTPPPKPLV